MLYKATVIFQSIIYCISLSVYPSIHLSLQELTLCGTSHMTAFAFKVKDTYKLNIFAIADVMEDKKGIIISCTTMITSSYGQVGR